MLTFSLSEHALKAIDSPEFNSFFLDDMVIKILRRLRDTSLSIHCLEKESENEGYTAEDYAYFWFSIERLISLGIIETNIVSSGRSIACIRGVLPSLMPEHKDNDLLRLSRFTSFRSDDGGAFLVESPLNAGVITLYSEDALMICFKLARGTEYNAILGHNFFEMDRESVKDLILSFSAVGAIDEHLHCDVDSLVQWEHHDALFHALSRGGRRLGSPGGTYRFLGKRLPEPALPVKSFLHAIELPKNCESEEVVTLKGLLERRRSVRTYGDKPLTAANLGDFLRLTSRIHYVETANQNNGRHYDIQRRGYPGGGACHELEVYPVVKRCDGLEPGVYWYDGYKDVICFLSPLNIKSKYLLDSASRSMGSSENPDVLICVGARFGRVNWKYEGLAYSVVLKDVGVLLQLMDLVATALKLAPCILGRGDSVIFAEVTDNKLFIEESVGEFALGSLPSES